ncbi:oxidoreductase [Mesobacillus maritimus]|uniref:oxidoreductase n=1 Tax=Mesobacillus maritimus TaxID=1643336 RepID=UPI00203B6E43|nr:oxidoreductase [Mesobacillus maritimus]MCM3585246.1 oxidoreductase [Mesobacillus maritimus]
MQNTALVVGATGLVGNELVTLLLTESKYEKVKVLTRRTLPLTHPKLEQFVVDFDQLASYQDEMQVEDVYCCLGTTIKKAGTQEAFKKVDFTYPVELAKLTREKGAQKFFIITAMGATKDTKVFYSRVKGEVEEDVKKLGFHSLHIFRPSLLLGERKEFRFGEKIGVLLSPLFSFLLVGSLKKFKPIHARDVAKAMYQASLTAQHGQFIHENDEIHQMSQKL